MSFPRKIVRRLVRKPQFKYLHIYAKQLDGPLPEYQAKIPIEFEVLPADVSEVRIRLAHIPAEHTSDIERRISNGHICHIAKYDREIVHTSWLAFSKCYSYALDRDFELGDDEAYMYSAFTLPKYRGKGIQPAVGCQRLELLKRRGYQRAIIFIEPANSSAKRMPEKLGHDQVGVTGFVELFGLRWYFHMDRGNFGALKRRSFWRKV